MGMNEARFTSQYADLSGCLVPLAVLLRASCEMPFVIGRYSGSAYPRGRCRRR